jgi:hypothetical protein
MTRVVVRLEDIVTDVDNPVDLSTLPESEAADVIQGLYGFISPLLEVSVSDGLATITFPEESERKATAALRQIEDASRAAA